jgi:hypothetical protein
VTPIRVILVYAEAAASRTLSYHTGWPKWFARSRRFECLPVNLLERGARARLGAVRTLRRRDADAIVLLHSVFSNEPHLGGRAFAAVAANPLPKALFLANEYKDMPAKLRFAQQLGISLLVTQSTHADVQGLYRERLPGVAVTGIVNAGVDLELFAARTPVHERPIDIGYRSYEAPWYLGHVERSRIAAEVVARSAALRTDISLDEDARFGAVEWAAFLDSCRAQLGCEAGTDYLELDDRSRLAVNAYLAERPDATFDEVYDRFFRDYRDPVSGRVLSARVAEAAATGTVQILVEGHYDGYFEPDVHYIPLRKDFSNVDEALAKLQDAELAAGMAARARDVATSELRYERLVDRFADDLDALL